MNKQNQVTLRKYYDDLSMSVVGGSLNCQLYLDTDTGLLSINHAVNESSWLQRDDGSLIRLHSQQTNPEWSKFEDTDSGDYSAWIDDVLGEHADKVA